MSVTMTDRIGLGLWVFGIAFEVVADRQKARWMKEKREKKHSEEFLTKGLWSRSRHPNYFGESTLWTGIAVASAGTLMGAGFGPLTAVGLSAVSPAFVTFLLLKVSGVPLSERKYDAKFGEREDYQRWKRETPKYFPKIFG
jgi:steroid 5-alpha reductase family enzyme